MQDSELLCPVCGKYSFDSFDEYVACPKCGWEGNLPQFNDHELADSINALSVNECKIQYAAMSDPELRPTVRTMQREFLKSRRAIKDGIQFSSTGNTAAEDFEIILPALIEGRKLYVAELEALLAAAK